MSIELVSTLLYESSSFLTDKFKQSNSHPVKSLNFLLYFDSKFHSIRFNYIYHEYIFLLFKFVYLI